ncbi:NAD(P)-binding protein [Mycena venus]|uniref:NAD(P)-binding protein n=1 Tax=Mycena venus TaxID=2733690 RepID=A0A8H6Z445_9AGAR|nr:NAD(P)-binding protein [Mycena venus]
MPLFSTRSHSTFQSHSTTNFMGARFSQFFPPKSEFSVDDIPDLTGQVIIVTGGNSGIGKETVKALLQHNAKVYLGARSPEKAKEAIDDLKSQTGKQAEFLELDLADLHSVKRAAQEFNQKETQLHVLFNSGGVMLINVRVDNLFSPYSCRQSNNLLPKSTIFNSGPMCWVNYPAVHDFHIFSKAAAGHFYFTKLLLPTLQTTVVSGKPARVVNTASLSAELFGQDINYNTLKESPAREKMGAQKLYHQSKFGNVAFSNELFRRYGNQGIVSVALNPGNLKTGLTRHIAGAVKLFIINLMLYPAPYGALTQLWAGTTNEGATFGGKVECFHLLRYAEADTSAQYLIPWARIGTSPSTDPAAEKALWTWLEEQVENLDLD